MNHGRGGPLNMLRRRMLPGITERLEGRVKGLTSVFPVLLLAIPPAVRCFSGLSRSAAVGKTFGGGGKHEFSGG